MLAEVWPFVDAQRRAGRPVVLARLVGRDGPGARPLGATLALTADGAWRGSLSGGCVEGMVIEQARALFTDGRPHLTSVSPGGQLMPWEERPACAGDLRVLITHAPPGPVHDAITAALAVDRPLAVRVGLTVPYAWSAAAPLTSASARATALPAASMIEMCVVVPERGASRLAAPRKPETIRRLKILEDRRVR